jgi:polar amino acid transport system substrate-binding protein
MLKTIQLLSQVGVALALSFSFVAAAQAEGKLQEVLARGKLIVGTGSTNAPWGFQDKSGKLAGFDIDLAHILAKGLFNDPNKVEFVTQSSDARIPNITTGQVDITCQAMTVTAPRAQQVAFTIPYYREGVALLLNKGGKYADYAALKAAGASVTVSVLQNVYAETMVHAALPDAKVDQFDNVALMYQSLNSHRADAAATDASSLRWFMKQNPDKYADAGYGWNPQNYSCAVKQGDADWLQFINTAIEQALSGVDYDDYKKAYEAWFGVMPPAPKIGFPN